MVATVYFVSYFLHNKDNDGWAYKIVNKYNDISAAKKGYYAELASHIDTAVYDVVSVTLTDGNGNPILHDTDQKVTPEPEPVSLS